MIWLINQPGEDTITSQRVHWLSIGKAILFNLKERFFFISEAASFLTSEKLGLEPLPPLGSVAVVCYLMDPFSLSLWYPWGLNNTDNNNNDAGDDDGDNNNNNNNNNSDNNNNNDINNNNNNNDDNIMGHLYSALHHHGITL